MIRKFYSPEKYKIVVIDDNSNKEFIKADKEYLNVQYIQSEFPKRGELLPFYYFYKYHFFDNAVIIHDSVFFQKKINFNKIKLPILPLWHFEHEKKENFMNSIRLIKNMNMNHIISEKLYDNDKYTVLSFNNLNWMGCFGCQCYISHSFLSSLQNKYNLFSLLQTIKNREDRCCLERIIGVIFCLECSELTKIKTYSLFGPISQYMKWGYSFDEYYNDKQNKKLPKLPLIKVWTGR
jgi:hypothetical protein